MSCITICITRAEATIAAIPLTLLHVVTRAVAFPVSEQRAVCHFALLHGRILALKWAEPTAPSCGLHAGVHSTVIRARHCTAVAAIPVTRMGVIIAAVAVRVTYPLHIRDFIFALVLFFIT